MKFLHHLNTITFAVAMSMAFFAGIHQGISQNIRELNHGWYAKKAAQVTLTGEALTENRKVSMADWLPATVPGTVLTTLLNNHKVPDPFYNMNNELIDDIYHTGNAHYTYWFYNEFEVKRPGKEQFWLLFRGVNYTCDIYLNGKKLNKERQEGMLLRQKYLVTPNIHSGVNHLAVIVFPPDPPGNPNGGQGGDGTIAKNATHQYVAGWDWIQPVRDRNTGIWDKVLLKRTGEVEIDNTHVITKVPGKRYPGRAQPAATFRLSTRCYNTSKKTIAGELRVTLDDKTFAQPVRLAPHSSKTVHLDDITIDNPRLWWPNGYGSQARYRVSVSFKTGSHISDLDTLHIGIREIQTEWNPNTQSRQIRVNGQKIFIKGGNWIISDAMLRFSEARYDAEVRMHRDMHLNTIRIWGGAIIERPEFYDACDKYGLLVMQDFGISGDCNGRWYDPKKKEDQWTRRNYPDDKKLFLTTAADQIRLIRNHPSLAFWCGGNELPPPESILLPLQDTLRRLDGTRWFVPYSTSDEMSFNQLGANGDGPYGIQDIRTFFRHRTFPFNSEVGSVGLPDIEGLKRYLPDSALVVPGTYISGKDTLHSWRDKLHPAWIYHKYLPYRNFIDRYGKIKDISDYAFKAQLVNYNQYRGLAEGFSSHMWQWYTGFIIWKTQNPWTAMRGQMYDYYLDANACLFGLRNGSEPLHIYLNPATWQIMVTNNTFETQHDLMISVHAYDMKGNKKLINQEFVTMVPTATKAWGAIGKRIKMRMEKEVLFLDMKLLDTHRQVVSENFYWLPDSSGSYAGLTKLPPVTPQVQARQTTNRQIRVTLAQEDSSRPVSFFNRLSLIDKSTGKRLLPVFYSDNYISIPPGEKKTIIIDAPSLPKDLSTFRIRVQGWNTKTFDVEIQQ